MARLNAPLPASEAFTIEYVEGGDIVSASLDIWPLLGTDDCTGAPMGPQHYALAMTPTGSADTLTFRATIPPLQVDTSFCFRVSPRQRVSKERFARVAVTAMERLFTNMLASAEACARSASLDAFHDALTDAANAQGIGGPYTRTAAEVAFSKFSTAGGETFCAKMGEAEDESRGHRDAFEQNDQAVEDARAAIDKLPLLPGLASPLVLLENPPKPVHLALATMKTAEEVERLIASLQAQRASDAVRAWQEGLASLVEELKPMEDATKRKEAIAARGKKLLQDIKAPEAFSFVVGGELVDVRELLPGLKGLAPRQAHKQLQDQKQAGTIPKGHAKLVEQWLAAMDKWAKADEAKDELIEKAVQSVAAVSQARESTRKGLVDAFTSEEVRLVLIETRGPIELQSQSGHGKTPDLNNYASLDAGILISGPRWAADAWVLPYLGLNLYSVPVDRKIAFRDLVGSELSQRLSLTLGFTLATPTVTGRTVEGLFLGKFPVLALGLRVTQYTRITGGAVLYRYRSANPASVDTHLGASGFVGASLDIDVIYLLTKASL